MKKIVSLFLSIIMIISVFAVSIATVNAGQTQYVINEETNKVAMYLDDYPWGSSAWVLSYAIKSDGSVVGIPQYKDDGTPVNVLYIYEPNVEQIIVPSHIKTVCSKAIRSSKLKRIVFEEGVERLEGDIFNNMWKSNLKNTEIVLPNSLKRIGRKTWDKISDYTSLPAGCIIVEDYSTNNNNTSQFYSANVSPTGTEEFEENGVHWQVFPYNKSLPYEGWDIRIDINYPIPSRIIIPESYNGIDIVSINASFFGDHYLTGGTTYSKRANIIDVQIPNTIKLIQSCAFKGFSNWRRIVIPDSVEFIDDSAFSSSKTCKLKLGNGIKHIGNSAFGLPGCLNEVVLPESLEYIGDYAFRGVGSALKKNRDSIPTQAWDDSSKEGLDVITYIIDKNRCFQNLVIPKNIKHIGVEAFALLGHLNSATFYNNDMSDISSTAFRGTSIGDIYIKDSVESADAYLPPIYGSDASDISVESSVSNAKMISFAKKNNFKLTTNGIIESGNSKDAIVTLTTETANLRVTVPTVLPVTVDSDNNVTVADNAQIINSSKGQVDVTNAILSGNNSWTLAAFNTDFKQVPVDTKQYGFNLQGYNVPVNGNAFNNQFDTIDGNAALDLSYDANVAIQSEAVNAAEIGNIVFTVAWHK